MHLLRLDKDFSFWVDTGPLERKSDIAPFVGIRNDQVENLFAELLGIPKDNWIGTIGANVGYVLNEGYSWWDSPTNPEQVIAKIEAALERYRPYLSLEKIIDAWNVANIPDPDRLYREPVILFLLGEYDAVMQGLEKAREVFCKQEDEICEQFRGYEQRILSKMKSIIQNQS